LHLEALFHDGLESAAARRVPNRALELHLSSYERLAPALKVPEHARAREPMAPPPDDARGHQDETNEQQRNEPSATRG
jgi:hypothetical protein